MHSQDPNKSHKEFSSEIQAIFAGTSEWHRPNNRFDFERFIFLEWDFREFIFQKHASFSEATFTKGADFWKATFVDGADFTMAAFIEGARFSVATFTKAANFVGAMFTKDADFWRVTFTEAANFGEAMFTGNANFCFATFTKGALFIMARFTEGALFFQTRFTEAANFRGATFTGNANFSFARLTEGAGFAEARFCDAAFFDDANIESTVGSPTGDAIVDFRGGSFLKPGLVRFLRTNQDTRVGLRARFVNCRMEGVQFDAVRWYRSKGRIVLQDEVDLLERAEDAPSYEEVSIAYRRLTINFEKARAYDSVEDCTIGEFEMKRTNPDRFLFVEWLKPAYERSPLVRTMGEWASVAGIYRLASLYGTSYQRAMGVLGLLLLVFGFCFSTIVDIHPIEISENRISTCGDSNVFQGLCGGLMHALEVATFQRTWLYAPVSAGGRIVEIFEQVLVAGQSALLLFALRRRFRR